MPNWRKAVHPRVCGEQAGVPFAQGHSYGSSPRVRGTVGMRPGRAIGYRFIPACAGNSHIRTLLACRLPVHPRVCGEQAKSKAHFLPHAGSSPRVRGTADPCLPLGRVSRFIPACAGNSAVASPHVRTTGGSSPRVRGTASARLSTHLYRRFIPACAGNSERWQRLFSTMAVHPRVCGEQGRWGVWGDASPRFIPACAGNSSTSRSETRAPAVHPRVCGEQLSSLDRLTSHLGSSPRVRGTGIGRACDHFDRRFIPACAGNRHHSDVIEQSEPVHPRVCGEQR